MNTGIYAIESPSGNQYIGSAIDIKRRWRRHRKDLRNGSHGNKSLVRSAKKYGIDSFSFRILLICLPQHLLMYEQAAIDGLKPKYNLAPIAGSSLGIKRSSEFRRKISAALRQRIITPETRARIGNVHRGKKLPIHVIEALVAGRARNPMSIEQRRKNAKAMHTTEAKERKRMAMIGRSVSQETRAKISASLKGRPHSPERAAAIREGRNRASLQND